MRRGSGAIVLLDLDARRDEPLHRRIYAELRRQILDGRLRRGARLPSTRSLAVDLRVSRSTIVQAFDQLRAEGYIDSISRGSTRVSLKLPDGLINADRAAIVQAASSHAEPSKRAAAIGRAWPAFNAISDQ